MLLGPATLLNIKLEIAAFNWAMISFANVTEMDDAGGIVLPANWQIALRRYGKAYRIPLTIRWCPCAPAGVADITEPLENILRRCFILMLRSGAVSRPSAA